MNSIKFVSQIVFHPLDCFDLIKRDKEKTPWRIIISILILTALCKLMRIFFVSYHFNDSLVQETNYLVSFGILYIPLLSWIVGSYSTTTLMSGEAKFTEILTASIFCYIPYIIATPVLIGFSYIFSTNESIIYNSFQAIILIWIIILNFAAFIRLNDYGFLKGLAVAFIGIIAVLLIWAVIILLFVFVYQVALFFKELFLEIKNQSII